MAGTRIDFLISQVKSLRYLGWFTRARIVPPFCLVVTFFIFGAVRGEARFRHTDALHIDPEDETNRETYNDKLSYRAPYTWDQEWERKRIGYRSSAGSLNNRRFLFSQDVKFQTSADSPWYFAYQQNQADDMVEQITSREMRLGHAIASRWRLDLLGDGDLYKEFGDLGLALMSKAEDSHQIEFYFWSVDHYYNQKKVEGENSYGRVPMTLGTRSLFLLPREHKIKIHLEYDTPMTWIILNRGVSYQYQSSYAWVGWSMPLSSSTQMTDPERAVLSAKIAYQDKKEEIWPSIEKLQDLASRSEDLRQDEFLSLGRLARMTYEIDIHVHWPTLSLTYDGGVWGLYRRANIEKPKLIQTNPDAAIASDIGKIATSESLFLRREEALYGSVSGPTPVDHVTWYQGFTANYVQISFTPDREGLELKYDLAFEIKLNQEAKVFLNTTWDIDQLRDDFPYKKRRFRPWGGGNIQFLATF